MTSAATHHLPYHASAPNGNAYSTNDRDHDGRGSAYGYGYSYDAHDEYDPAPYQAPVSGSGPGPGPGPGPRFARPPPPHAGPPPPAYQRMTRRFNALSLRPVLLFTTFISFLYLLFIGITSLREINQRGNSTRLKVFNIVIGVLLLLAALVEVLGFSAAWARRVSWARSYARASTVAFACVVGAEVVGLVEHYAAKRDLIDGCTTRNTGATAISGSGWSIWGSSSTSDGLPLTAAEAREYCQSRWNSQGVWTIVWMVIVLFLGVIFVMLAFSFLRQLNDPSSSIRFNGRGGAASAQYSAAFNYDESETSPFDTTGGANNGPYAYPPPAHPPGSRGPPSQPSEGGFSASSSDAPEYVADDPDDGKPRRSMQSIDLDRKESIRSVDGGTEAGYEYEYTLDYASGARRGRPESSRSVRRGGEEEGRRSDETLRGEEQEEGLGGRAGGAKV